MRINFFLGRNCCRAWNDGTMSQENSPFVKSRRIFPKSKSERCLRGTPPFLKGDAGGFFPFKIHPDPHFEKESRNI
jgi:hypothetical protein